MQIGSRFAEYGLIGAFFWIAEAVAFAVSGRVGEISGYFASVSRLAGDAPASQTILTNLVSAFAVVAVFVTGMILDLVSSLFIQIEMGVFKRHIDRNDAWLAPIIAANATLAAKDYVLFHDEFGDPLGWNAFVRGARSILIWKRDVRVALRRDWSEGAKRWRLVPVYLRLWNLFNAQIALFVGKAQPYLLADHYYLWRAARAVAVTFLIVGFHSQWFLLAHAALPRGLTVATIAAMVAAFVLEGVTYSRLCYALFAVMFVAHSSHNSRGAAQ